jgi:glycosyltransferase involved in cell wall biosynthesis
MQGYEADLYAIGLKLILGMKPTPGILSKIFSFYEMIVLRASDKILCVGPNLADYARSLLPKKMQSRVELIPHSLQYIEQISEKAIEKANDIADSLERNERNRFLVMVVGMGLLKGSDIALWTQKYITQMIPNALMVFVSKSIPPKYIRLAKELGVSNCVVFLNGMDRDVVLALLRRGSVFLSSSFSEGFSWANAEAMALSIPVVTYMNKSIRDAVGRGAVRVVSTTDPRDYARECLSLIRDEKVRKELVHRALDYIQPFVLFTEKSRLELICNNMEQVLSKRR